MARAIVCVGDSITVGSGAPAGYDYPAILGQMLGSGYSVLNYGFAGRTMSGTTSAPYYGTFDYNNSLTAAGSIHGADVVCMLGTNDSQAAHFAFIGDFISTAETMIAAWYAAGADRVFLCLPPPATTSSPVNGALIETDILPLLRTIAATKTNGLINIHDAIAAAFPNGFLDGVHPNADGNVLIAETVMPFVRLRRRGGRPVSLNGPVITSINYQVVDPSGGGNAIVITGTNLGPSAVVTIGGLAQTLSTNTATSLSFTPIAMTARKYTLQVANSSGIAQAEFEYWTPSSELGCKLFAKSPDYSDTGDGSWTASVGSPLVSGTYSTPTATGGAPDFTTPGQGLVCPGTFSGLMGLEVGSCAVVFTADSAAAPAGAQQPYDDAGLLAHDNAGAIGVGWSTSGVRAFIFDGTAGAYKSATAACATGTHSAVMRWSNARDLGACVDGGVWATTAIGSPGSIQTTDTLHIGSSWNGSAVFDGRIKMIALFDLRVSNAFTSKFNVWAQQRYA